jgi:hypothetical protein
VTLVGVEPDGININDGCGSTDLALVGEVVRGVGADLGLAFDGDGDRALAVDATGTPVDGDQILAICALDLRSRGALAGDAVLSLWITTSADRLGRRRMLVLGAGLMVLAGALFATTRSFAALLVAAALWSTGAWGRVQGGWDAWRLLEEDALAQKETLAKEREVRNDTARAVQGLDSGYGYDPAKLVAEAVNATRDAGLSANTDAPKPTKAGKFAVHSLQFSCRKADIGSILRFYDSVKTRAPYLAIGDMVIR